jgi:hypothetical protein
VVVIGERPAEEGAPAAERAREAALA